MKKINLKLLVATRNVGKIKELEDFLSDLPLQLRSLKDFPETVEPEETETTFSGNAVLKARSYALQTNLWALADDSGLEVEALNGAPGVFSARYAGENADDNERTEKLLRELNQIKEENRRARFVCAMAIVDEKGDVKFIAEGVCDGKIALAAKGENGFGYDPVFIPENFTKTFGELPAEIKQKISHRHKAIEKIIQFLRGFQSASV